MRIVEFLKKFFNKVFKKNKKMLGNGMSFDNDLRRQNEINLSVVLEKSGNKAEYFNKNSNIETKKNIIDENSKFKKENIDDYEKRNAKYINFDENTNMFEFLVSAVITNPEYLKLQKSIRKLDEKKEEFLKLKNKINKLIEDDKN